jgi:hypothetical protein
MIRTEANRISVPLCTAPTDAPDCATCDANPANHPDEWSSTPDKVPQWKRGTCQQWQAMT